MSRRVQAVFDRSPDVENLCEETREVLRMLGQSFDCTDHYLKRAVVSLLTKAGDDLKALALVWFAGHTSASNAVMRVLIEGCVDLMYIVTAHGEEQGVLARRYMFFAIGEHARRGLELDGLQSRCSEGTDEDVLYDPSGKNHRANAVSRALDEIRRAPEYRELIPIGESMTKLPTTWHGLKFHQRVAKIGTSRERWPDPRAYQRLQTTLITMYSAGSGFVHGSEAFWYSYTDASPHDGAVATVTARFGPIEERHEAPIIMALDVISMMVTVVDHLLGTGLGGSIRKMIEGGHALFEEIMAASEKADLTA